MHRRLSDIMSCLAQTLAQGKAPSGQCPQAAPRAPAGQPQSPKARLSPSVRNRVTVCAGTDWKQPWDRRLVPTCFSWRRSRPCSAACRARMLAVKARAQTTKQTTRKQEALGSLLPGDKHAAHLALDCLQCYQAELVDSEEQVRSRQAGYERRSAPCKRGHRDAQLQRGGRCRASPKVISQAAPCTFQQQPKP